MLEIISLTSTSVIVSDKQEEAANDIVCFNGGGIKRARVLEFQLERKRV